MLQDIVSYHLSVSGVPESGFKRSGVTAAALEEFEEGERNGPTQRTRSGKAIDLRAWRNG